MHQPQIPIAYTKKKLDYPKKTAISQKPVTRRAVRRENFQTMAACALKQGQLATGLRKSTGYLYGAGIKEGDRVRKRKIHLFK